MTSNFQWLTVLSISLQVTVCANTFANEQAWTISREQAQCLVENIQGYLSRPGDVQIIKIYQCPDTTEFGDFGEIQNFGGVSKIPTEKNKEGFDKIISFSSKSLSCLTLGSIKFEGKKALVPKQIKCAE